MSHYLPSNLKHLRGLKGQPQDVVAGALGVTRSSYAGYERGAAEPKLDVLLAMGAYYRLTIDLLLKYDLCTWPNSKVEQLQRTALLDATDDLL